MNKNYCRCDDLLSLLTEKVFGKIWINKNELRIHNRARNLYYLISNGHTTKELLRRCCDFRLLEKKCDDYMLENEVNEEEILYCYFLISSKLHLEECNLCRN